MFDDCLNIADEFDAEEIIKPEHINRAKLRIDTRKWMAGKLRPKKYGDKLETTLEAGDSMSQLLKLVSDNTNRAGQD